MASLALTQNSGWLVKLDGGLVLHQDLSPSSPYSTRPRQIYIGHFIKVVRQWEDLLVARTSNSDLLAEKSPQIQEGLVNTGEHKREVAEPASAPDVDTNNTETLPGLYRLRSAQ